MSKPTRTRRTAEQWRALIEEQASSGQSQSEFCKRKRLSLSTFTNWKRTLSLASSDRKESAPAPSPWIDLGSVGAKGSGWEIELDLGGGVCLRLRRS